MLCVHRALHRALQGFSAVSWHEDDLKISHKNTEVVDQFVEGSIKKHEDGDISSSKSQGTNCMRKKQTDCA